MIGPGYIDFPGGEPGLRALLEATPNAVVMIDADGMIMYCNPSTARMFGYAAEELLHHDVCMLMPEPYRSQHDHYLHNHLQTGQAVVIGVGREVEGLRKDGTRFAAHLSVGRVSTAGAPAFVGIISDISERVASMEALRHQREIQEVILLALNSFLRRESEEEISIKLSRALLKATDSEYALVAELLMGEDGGEILRTLPLSEDLIPDWSFATRLDNGALEFNQLDSPVAFPVFSGAPVLANDPYQHPAWFGSAGMAARMRNFLAIPIRIHSTVIGVLAVANRAGGYDESMLAELAPVQETLAAVLYARRVRREAEHYLQQQLRASRQLNAIIEHAPIGVAVIDADGFYETVNRAYGEIYEYSPAEMKGRIFTMVFPQGSQQAVLEMHRNYLQEGGSLRGQWSVITRSGVPKHIVSESVLMHAEDGSPKRLVFVTDMTEQITLQNDLRKANALLRDQAEHDGLTGLYNHRRILEILDVELNRLQRKGNPLCVALLDLDNFKLVNDQHGHLVGDEVLISVAKALQSGIREIDAVGRYGGEEFLVILPDTLLATAQHVIERLRIQVEMLTHSVPSLRLSFSAGLTAVRSGESSGDALFRVDALLYEAKRRGRGCTQAGEPGA